MVISLIAAMAENRVIGRGHAIPWNIPSDQKRFRDITIGHSILFGRITFETIGRPLDGRRNIILTRKRNYCVPGATVAHSLEEAMGMVAKGEELFICGGGTVYEETISLAQKIYLSVIHRPFDGDTYFPEIPSSFREISKEEIANSLPYSFIRYERPS